MLGDSSLKFAEQKVDPLFVDQALQYYEKAIKACQDTSQDQLAASIDK